MQRITKENIEDKVFTGTDLTGAPVTLTQNDKIPGVVKDQK